MNYFLILVILAIGGGAYYEYTAQHEIILTDQQQISDLTDKVAGLQADNKKLTDGQTQLAQNLSGTQKKIDDLNAELQAAKKSRRRPAARCSGAGRGPISPSSNK